jgi:hypothetical protein
MRVRSAMQAIAVGATAAAFAAGCGGLATTKTTATTTPRHAPDTPGFAKDDLAAVRTGGPRGTTGRPGQGRALAGSLADQDQALAVLIEETDLPAGWRAEGRAMNGLVTLARRRRDFRPLDLGCFAGDRPRTVAALASSPPFAHRSRRLDANAIVYADAGEARGALAFLHSPGVRRCFAGRLRAARGGGAVATDIRFLGAGPAIAILQLSAVGGAGDGALPDRLAAMLRERLRASYG